MKDKIIESIAYTLPAIVTGFVAYLMFSQFIKQNNNEKKFDALIKKKQKSLPLKLQAYERLILFSERIHLSKLLIRIKPIGEDTASYCQLLLATIEQEFEHNMVQQIYISNKSWQTVVSVKNIIKAQIIKASEIAKTAQELRENLLIDATQKESATQIAISTLKKEVKKLL